MRQYLVSFQASGINEIYVTKKEAKAGRLRLQYLGITKVYIKLKKGHSYISDYR